MACIMVQGTTSSAGKSFLCAALCRIFKEDGYKVMPFKSQNMSLNSYVTIEGLEMGRAQVLQAQAAGVEPSCLMNPILLKPTTDRKSQIIIKGKPYRNMKATNYFKFKKELKPMIKDIYEQLHKKSDIVVIEGAGSPAEINLKDDDIVNMGMAKMADSPVLLIGDIDKGGVFASIYGTIMLLEEEERKRIKGIVINKFRGDKSILQSGLDKLEKLTNIPVVGVLPYMNIKLEDEDGAIDFTKEGNGSIDVRVLKFPRISNFTDLDAFKFEEDVSLSYVQSKEEIQGADMIIIPGSKNTIEDLRFLKKTGIYDEIKKFKGIVFGICGGYQMMGTKIIDVEGWEVEKGQVEKGIDLFDTQTEFKGDKITTNINGTAFGKKIKGYEIHCGRTIGNQNPFVRIQDETGVYHSDGEFKDGRYFGTYVHGIFDSGEFRQFILNIIRRKKRLKEKNSQDLSVKREEELNKLAKVTRENMDMDYIYSIINM